MKGKPRTRFSLLALIILSMMGLLIWQLSNLTLAEGEFYADKAKSRSTSVLYTTGARGRILDRNGIPLAYDESSYNVQFSRHPERLSAADSALYTESLIAAIEIIEQYGASTIDTFYIKKDEEQEGSYRYDWGVTAESSVKARYKNFCQNMGLKMRDAEDPSTWDSADVAYQKLRAMWQIPVEMPFEQATKIMSIRQEVNMNKWRAYEPITIAYNVPMEVVARLEMQGEELLGISTIQSTTRVYPWGETAAHIIGYLSRQVNNTTLENLESMGYSYDDMKDIEDLYTTVTTDEGESELIQMTKLGYSYNDYIGVAGIERTMERYLTANTREQRGQEVLEVNKHGTITRGLEKTYASNGNDVMLTIDLQLQQVAESALKHAIEKVRADQEREIAKDLALPEGVKKKYSNHDKIKMAETGCIVILDVNTGKLLAMANYPSFDPSVFLSPISEEDEKKLFGEGSNMPTLNRAIGTRMAPGSIFKMATGLAGLVEGAITVDSTIDDKSPYTDFVSGDTIKNVKEAPNCWVSNPSRHSGLNVTGAITKSCNYFFFTVADRIGISKLNEWATRLGMSTPTGIELPGELSGHIGGQSVLYDNTRELGEQKSSLPYYVYRQVKKYLEWIMQQRPSEVSTKTIEDCARKIVALQDGVSDDYGNSMRRLLSNDLGIPITVTQANNWVNVISSMLYELKWKPVMTVRTGMGQGITSVTPIAVARYAATFANGGTVFDVHVVDRIIDENGKAVKVFEPTVHDKIDAPQEYWDAIRAGLEAVTSDEDGTASNAFTTEFTEGGYRSQIFGKSGTAQISTAQNNIDIENTSWFVTYMPVKDPEIVVISCIPYGLSGAGAGIPATEEITRFYIDRKTAYAKENLVKLNGLIP